MLVDVVQPQRNLSHSPLFQAAFSLQNIPMQARRLQGLTVAPLELESGVAQFDLLLTMEERGDILSGNMDYNADLFDAATIERMMEHFQILLAGAVSDPKRPVSRLPLLSAAEEQMMLVEWNRTETPFPDDATIHQLFEAQAARIPDAVAVTFEEQSLTYAELDRKANQLAHYLQKLGVGPEVLVGVCTLRSPEMIVGIMGVLKAGGAYVPLDPNYPPERLAYMIQDSQAPVLLTQSALLDHLPDHQAVTVQLDADWSQIGQEPVDAPASGAKADNLAYVIYTSGSTGLPKGTMLAHRGLCNLTDVQRRQFFLQEGKRVLQFSALSFDASVWEVFQALRNGATICLARQEVLAAGAELVELMQEQRITTATLPPSLLSVLPETDLPHLETLISAGEHCSGEIVARWSPGRRFFNAYGPTETTVCASMHLVQSGREYPQGPSIGMPIANFQLYVLDANLLPAPVGVPGELFVGGAGLARGYLRRPALTAERFIPNPFSSEPGQRLYRTGDLVRYLSSGDVEFLGRIDHQVKLRGFRIELGEIEAVLRGHPQVDDAVVLAQGDDLVSVRLAAYVVAQDGAAPTVGDLRDYLRSKLPEYMTPAYIIVLDAFPLTPSGKIDRKALPAPDASRLQQETPYVAPRTPVEEQLTLISAELLGLEQVGVDDNFFELGGHSLLATQFISRVRDAFGVEVPLRKLFETPTVAGIAEAVEAAQQVETQPQRSTITRASRSARRMKRSDLK
jgi:amino acid adenylation domain-containing protein